MKVIKLTVTICYSLSEAYGRNPDQMDSIFAKAGARVGFVKLATARIERAHVEPDNVTDMIILHNSSAFAAY